MDDDDDDDDNDDRPFTPKTKVGVSRLQTWRVTVYDGLWCVSTLSKTCLLKSPDTSMPHKTAETVALNLNLLNPWTWQYLALSYLPSSGMGSITHWIWAYQKWDQNFHSIVTVHISSVYTPYKWRKGYIFYDMHSCPVHKHEFVNFFVSFWTVYFACFLKSILLWANLKLKQIRKPETQG